LGEYAISIFRIKIVNPEDGDSKFIFNIGTYLSHYMASQKSVI
jgi:hypothetical protein